MQTIKVTATATTYGVAYGVQDGNFLGAVGKDIFNPGKWGGSFQQYGACNNCDWDHACKFVEDAITEYFGHFGINVEFIHQ